MNIIVLNKEVEKKNNNKEIITEVKTNINWDIVA